MKKIILFTLTVCFLSSLATSALALRWPDNAGRRVGAMGGATLAIEDETTATNLFNYQNTAGMAFLPKMNRIDAGLGLTSSLYKVTYPTYTYESTTSGFEFKRPGAEYRGVTYWLGDNLILRAGIEGMTYSSSDKSTPTVGTATEDKMAFSGIGGGASVVFKTDMGLALGAGLSYNGGSGKPDPLPNYLAGYGGTTDKFDATVTNLDWSVSAAFQAQNLGAEKNNLNLGVQLSADDSMPTISSLSSPSLSALGDYNLVVDVKGNITTLGDVKIKNSYSVAPMLISAQALYDIGSLLTAGLVLDMKSTSLKTKTEYSGFEAVPAPFAPQNMDYKTAEFSGTGISPVVTGKIGLAEDMALIPGLYYTTWGSGKTDSFSLNGTTADINDTYKSGTADVSKGTLGLGLGLQALSKQIQLALQFETGSDKTTYTPYAINGTSGTVSTTEGSRSNLRVGAEFWVLPVFALRAGFATLATTTKEGTVNSNGDVVDLINTSNIVTLGAGFSSPEGLAVDLLVELGSASQTPESDPKPTISSTNLYLGTRIPI